MPTPYEDWFAPYYPGVRDPDVIGIDADPNHDGIPNGGHFITATDPDASAPFGWPVVSTDGTTHTYTFRQSDRAATWNPRVMGSIDLLSWDLPENVAPGVSVTVIDEGFGTDSDGFPIARIVVEIESSLVKRFFVRQEWTAP